MIPPCHYEVRCRRQRLRIWCHSVSIEIGLHGCFNPHKKFSRRSKKCRKFFKNFSIASTFLNILNNGDNFMSCFFNFLLAPLIIKKGQSDRKSLEEKSRLSLSLRPKSVTFVCKDRNTGMVVLKWDAYMLLSTHDGAISASERSSNVFISLALIDDKYCHRTRKKGCESGFPYCFLTDFTKFFL